MTIASEITRIQGAKSDIRQAIIDKGVDVCADLTIDNYACCINDIPTGGGGTLVEVLVVGAGGNGGSGGNNSSCRGGGGGGGGVILCNSYKLTNSDVHIGQPNCGFLAGGDSWIGELTAKGGGKGGNGNCSNCCAYAMGHDGGNGGGGGAVPSSYANYPYGGEPNGYLNIGTNGKRGGGCTGGGGGGAGGYNYCNDSFGGVGLFSDITGEYCEYGRGGSSGNDYCGQGYGGGGGGCYCNKLGCGCQGIVVVRYPTECGYNITGGCKYTCGDYTIHCFTEDDFIISEPITGEYCIGYLVVGGGGSGYDGYNGGGAGGGGGDVKFGVKATTSSINIVVGGTGCSSCLGDEIIANGGCSAGYRCYTGGTSGSGNPGGTGSSSDKYSGGGGGALTRGTNGYYCAYSCFGGIGGYGIRGYGGGGGGASIGYMGKGHDGGGNGSTRSCDALPYNCGGGGGGYCYCCGCYSDGACGVVDICYPCDGSFGFSTATGGNSCYLCGKICVHRFTSNGTFNIVS